VLYAKVHDGYLFPCVKDPVPFWQFSFKCNNW